MTGLTNANWMASAASSPSPARTPARSPSITSAKTLPNAISITSWTSRTTPGRNAKRGARNPQSPIPNPQSPISNPDLYLPKTLKHLLRTRGRLPFAECLDIALGLATALDHLHGHGLVHRDIKSSNVIFVGGVPKLADIGLVTSIDATQSFVGTEGFFPPEGPGTAQADIFSLGKLLYEIATGKDRREFPELPADLATPEEQAALSELNAIILKACQHDPEKRHSSASALREELERLQRGRSVKRHRAWQRRWDRARKLALPAALAIVGVVALAALWRLQSAAEAKSKSPEARANIADQGTSTGLNPRAIFILPLRPADTNGAPPDLCSRITDAFIDSLGLLTNQGITVGPRKSGWAHLPESEQFQRVTNAFKMRHALTGKVRLTDDQYALTLGWWDLELGQPRWTETFRGRTNELVELERQALVKVARAFDLELTPDQDRQISQLLTNNSEALGYMREAYDVYARKGGTLTGYSEIQTLAERALNADPHYLDAHFYLAYMWRNLAQDDPPAYVWPAFRDRISQILTRDDTHTAALDGLAGYTLFYQHNWKDVVPILQRLFQSCPPPPHPYNRSFFRAFWLRNFGQFDEAQIEQAKAEQPEPTSVDERYFMAASRWSTRDYAGGARAARRTLELLPDHAEGHLLLAHCLVAMGDYTNGIQSIHDAQKVWERQEMTAFLAFTYARMGQPDQAREILRDLERQNERVRYIQPYFLARVYAALGENPKALDCLEQAALDRTDYLLMVDWGGLRTDYAWDTLQNEPRYWQLCDRLGLGKHQLPRKERLP